MSSAPPPDLDALVRARRWAELWRTARSGSPARAVAALHRLGSAGWRPPEESERGGFDHLVALARRCDSEPPRGAPFGELSVLDAGSRHYDMVMTRDDRILAAHAFSVQVWEPPWDTPATTFSLPWERRLFDRGTPEIATLAVTPDGRRAITGSRDGRIRMFDLPSGEHVATLRGHRDCLLSLAVSPDGRHLASASWDCTVRLWRLPSGRGGRVLHAGWHRCPGVPRQLAVSPDSRLLIGGYSPVLDSDSLRLWNLPRGTVAGTVTDTVPGGRYPQEANSVLVTPDGRLLAVASYGGTVRLYRLPSGAPAGTLEQGPPGTCLLAVTPDSRLLIGTRDERVRLWELPSGAPAGVPTDDGTGAAEALRATPRNLVVTPDGRLLAAGLEDGSVQLRHLPSGADAGTLAGHVGPVRHLATSADGSVLASRGEDTLRVWQSRFRTLVRTPSGEIARGEADRLVSATAGLPGPEHDWARLMAALTGWHHRFDVELADPDGLAGPPGTDDIELA